MPTPSACWSPPARRPDGRSATQAFAAAAQRPVGALAGQLDAADVRGARRTRSTRRARWSQRGAKLDETDPDGATALVIAIINAHYDMAALLLDAGADPNVVDNEAGMGPLYAAVDMHRLAVGHGRPNPKPSGTLTAVDVVRRLLERKANPNAALKTSTFQRHHTMGDLTLGEGATPLMRAAKSGDVEVMRLLLAAGADPQARLANQATALMFAAGLGLARRQPGGAVLRPGHRGGRHARHRPAGRPGRPARCGEHARRHRAARGRDQPRVAGDHPAPAGQGRQPDRAQQARAHAARSRQGQPEGSSRAGRAADRSGHAGPASGARPRRTIAGPWDAKLDHRTVQCPACSLPCWPLQARLLAAFHLWLLGKQAWTGQLEYDTSLRWPLAFGLAGGLFLLRRRGVSLRGRRATALWVLAAVLHGPAAGRSASAGAAVPAETLRRRDSDRRRRRGVGPGDRALARIAREPAPLDGSPFAARPGEQARARHGPAARAHRRLPAVQPVPPVRRSTPFRQSPPGRVE